VTAPVTAASLSRELLTALSVGQATQPLRPVAMVRIGLPAPSGRQLPIAFQASSTLSLLTAAKGPPRSRTPIRLFLCRARH
jgi:hypothetical protein